MNDATTGQLTGRWKLPPYARGNLYIEAEGGQAVRAQGENGLFTLAAPAEPGAPLVVRWGAADGPALAVLAWQADSLEWGGEIAIGGYVDALHTGLLAGMGPDDDALHLLFISGAPLRPSVARFPPASVRPRPPYLPPRLADDAADLPESTTTWIAWEGSAAVALAQDALVTKLPIFAFGRLAPPAAGWDAAFALPIALDALTLLPA